MRSKSSSFLQFLVSTCFKIYVLCESWLNHDILSSEFFTDEYIVYRCDRSSLNSFKSFGGGVIIAVHNSIKSSEISCPHNSIEYLAIKLSWRVKSLYIYALYIPPNSSSEVYMLHLENMKYFFSFTNINDITCVLGDFNLPKIDWCLDESDLLSTYPSNLSSDDDQNFLDGMQTLDLHQICKIPNQHGHYLDLIFMNNSDFGIVTKSLMPFIPERLHHFGLEISLDSSEMFCKFNNNSTPISNYNFDKADVPNLIKFLDKVNWDEIKGIRENNVNEIVKSFYEILYDAFDKFVPKYIRKNFNRPPWFDKVLTNLRNRKNKAHKLIKQFKDDVMLSENFQKIRKEFDTLNMRAYKTYVSNVEKDLTSDPRNFWKFVNVKRKTTGYPASMFLNDYVASDTQEICNLFADFFQSVYKKCDIDYVDETAANANCSNLIPLPSINEVDVWNGIMKMNQGCGADLMPSSILKSLASTLSKPLSLIFNKSLQCGIFPDSWIFNFYSDL